MKTAGRVIEDGAGMAKEVVADLLLNVRPEDLAGYIVIGMLRTEGFSISSNARDHEAEARILDVVAEALHREAAS